MARFRVSRKARTDIMDIGRHTQHIWGKDQRRIYLAGLEAEFRLLAESPNLAPERPEFSPRVHLFPYQQHIIVYLPDGDGILIIRVLHHRMDVPQHLT